MPGSLPYHLKPPEKYGCPPAQSSHYHAQESRWAFSSWPPPLAFLGGWSFHLVMLLEMGATQKVPVIGSQLLDLRFAGIIAACAPGFLWGSRMLCPHLMDVEGGGAPECGEASGLLWTGFSLAKFWNPHTCESF